MKLFILCQIFNQLFNFDSSQWNIKQFTIKNGLSSNKVYNIERDNNGRYWIASNAGLAYFDGYNFKYLTSENGIKNVDLVDMYYVNGYLYSINLNQLEAIDVRKIDDKFQTKLYHYSIIDRFGVEINKNDFIYYFRDSALIFNRLNKAKAVKIPLPYYDKKLSIFHSLQYQHISNVITHVNHINNNNIYYQLVNEIYYRTIDGTLRLHFKSSENANFISLDSNFFLVDYPFGLYKMYNRSTNSYRTILRGNKPLDFKLYENKGFWTTTYKSGIFLYTIKEHYKQSKLKFNYPYFHQIPSILLEDKQNEFDQNLKKDGQNYSFRYGKKWIDYNAGIKSLFKLNSNLYLIGRRDGTVLYRLGDDQNKLDFIDSSWVLSLKKQDKTVYILTYENFKILENGQKYTWKLNYKNQYVLVNDLEKIHNKYILGTNDLGVFISDTQFKHFTHITEKNGLQSKLIKKIKSDVEGNAWVLSDKGLDKISPQNKITRIFSISEIEDYDISNFSLSRDSVWLFSDENVYSFNYFKRFQKKNIPIVLNTVVVDDKKEYYEGDTCISIGPKWETIKINYAGIYVHEQESISYRYKIIQDGDTGSMQMTKQNSISLAALKSGSYTIIIQAYHQTYPHIQSKFLVIKFKIKPYFYETWWFYSLIFFGLLIIMGGILWYRNQLKLDKLRVESELHRLTLNGLQNQMNPHFVFNALNTLQHFILKKDMNNSLNFLSDFSSLIRKILENSRTDLVSIEEELSFLKQYVDIERERYQNKFKVEFICKIDEEELSDIKIPPMLIQPLIENAVKHGVSNKQSGGEISVVIELIDNDLVRVSVVDNGEGFKSSTSTSSKAITILKERLDLIQGKNKKSSFELIRKDNFTYSIINIPI